MTSDTSGSLSFLRTQLRRRAGEVVPVGTETPSHLDVADDDDGHTGDDDPEDNDDDVDGDEDNVDNELPSGKNPHRSEVERIHNSSLTCLPSPDTSP